MNDSRLMLLRIQLYGAAQQLKGEDLRRFWTLLDEVEHIRPDDMKDARYTDE